MTEPAVGASVWARGNQVWTGKRGTLMAKEKAKARKSQVCTAGSMLRLYKLVILNVGYLP